MNVWGRPPYQNRDRFRMMENDRYMIARPGNASLFIYNSDHEQVQRIGLHVKERSVERDDLEHEFRNLEREIRSRMEARVPEVKPPFLNIWLSGDHIWLHTDNHEEEMEIVVLTMEGEPVGKFYLSRIDDIRYARNNQLYTLHRDPETGHRIRIYHVNIEI